MGKKTRIGAVSSNVASYNNNHYNYYICKKDPSTACNSIV